MQSTEHQNGNHCNLLNDANNVVATTVAFTGHRPDKLSGYERESYRRFVSELAETLYREYYEHGTRRFISGGAQGFDQLAFWAIEKMKINYSLKDVENIVYVPFKGQDRRWKENGCFSRNEYNQMLARADEVVYLKEKAISRYEVVGALMGRNRAMIDDADRLIALCNRDDWMNSHGGTASAMQYAQTKKKPIDQLRFTIEDNKLAIRDLLHDICPSD